MEILRGQGVEELSLREAARRVGVSHTAPYRHFPDKEALVAALAEEGFRQLKERLDETASLHVDDPFVTLEEQALAYVRFALESRALFRMMFGGVFPDCEKYPTLRDASTAAFASLSSVIEEGQRRGKFAQGDPTRLALGAWSAAHGIATLLIGDHFGFLDLSTTAPEPVVRSATQRALEAMRP